MSNATQYYVHICQQIFDQTKHVTFLSLAVSVRRADDDNINNKWLHGTAPSGDIVNNEFQYHSPVVADDGAFSEAA